MTCNERFDLSDFTLGFGSCGNSLAAYTYMNGGFKHAHDKLGGVAWQWHLVKRAKSWHRESGRFILCFISRDDRGESFSIFSSRRRFLFVLDDKEASLMIAHILGIIHYLLREYFRWLQLLCPV